jgi:hypothetical protein
LHFKIIPGIETNVKTVICSHSTQPVMPGPAATEGRAKKKTCSAVNGFLQQTGFVSKTEFLINMVHP